MTLRRIGTSSLCAAFILTGCHKKVLVVAAPPLPPPVMISVPPPTHPAEPELEIPLEEAPALTELLPRRTVFRYRPSRLQQVTIARAPAPPIKLGQLTTGDTAPLRQQTEDLLREQQRRLSGISSAIVAQHSRQIEQARLFLRQAHDAWQKSDVDGALTLATKAKVLLDEVLT